MVRGAQQELSDHRDCEEIQELWALRVPKGTKDLLEITAFREPKVLKGFQVGWEIRVYKEKVVARDPRGPSVNRE